MSTKRRGGDETRGWMRRTDSGGNSLLILVVVAGNESPRFGRHEKLQRRGAHHHRVATTHRHLGGRGGGGGWDTLGRGAGADGAGSRAAGWSDDGVRGQGHDRCRHFATGRREARVFSLLRVQEGNGVGLAPPSPPFDLAKATQHRRSGHHTVTGAGCRDWIGQKAKNPFRTSQSASAECTFYFVIAARD